MLFLYQVQSGYEPIFEVLRHCPLGILPENDNNVSERKLLLFVPQSIHLVIAQASMLLGLAKYDLTQNTHTHTLRSLQQPT